MKSYHIFKNNSDNKSFIFEDKSERIKRREESRKKKRENKFTQGGEDFNLNKFIQVLSALKNSIFSKMTECQNRRLSEKEGKKTGEKYMGIFSKHDERVSLLLEEARYRKAQGEGKYLEGADDKATIDRFRKEYESLKNDFSDAEKKFQDDLNIEQEEITQNIKYGSIRKPLSESDEIFKKADEIYNNLEMLLSAEEDLIKPGTPSDKNTKIEIKKEIKSGTTPSGEDGELTKKVYKLICDKWSKSKTLTATNQWKKSIFCTPKSLIIGPNRTACIKAIKAAYGLKDTTGNITQELADELQKSEEVTESINYVIESSRVLSFSDFLSKKSRTNENIDIEALKRSIGEPVETSDNKKEKSKESLESPFKDREEGNDFRKWVNENDPVFAKKIDLDKEGSHTNSYIRKAWKELGEIYSKYKEQKKAGEESKAKAEAKAKIEDKAKKDAAAKKESNQSAINEIVVDLLSAMAGDTENESEVYKIFKRRIKDKETFENVEKTWNSVWPSSSELRTTFRSINRDDNPDDAIKKAQSKKKTGKKGWSFRGVFGRYFNEQEIKKLNSYVPDGVKKF